MNGDTLNVRLVIIFLGLMSIIGLVGGIYLASVDKQLPDFLTTIVGASVGAVAGILSKTSTGTQEVRVVDEPIEVTETVTKAAAAKAGGAAKKRGGKA